MLLVGDAAVAAAPSSPALASPPDLTQTLPGESFIPVYRRVGRHNATIGIYLSIHYPAQIIHMYCET